MKLKILQLSCRFCGKQTGTYKYPDNLYVADLGIVDVRCDEHEAEFGNYAKMEQDFKGTHDEFLALIKKANYKRAKFDVEIQKIKDAIKR